MLAAATPMQGEHELQEANEGEPSEVNECVMWIRRVHE